MIANSKTVKLRVREALRKNFFPMSVVCLIPIFTALIILMVFELLAFVIPLWAAVSFSAGLVAFLLYPLAMGMIRFFVRFIMGEAQDNITEIFFYFSSIKLYRRILNLQFLLGLRKFAILFLLSIPLIAVHMLSSPDMYSYFNISMPIWAQSLSYIEIWVRVFVIFFYLIVSMRYYLAPFLITVDKDMYSAEAIYMAKLISKRTVIDFAFLIFSHLFYILASILMVPTPFTLPYLVGAYVVHCDSAVQQYNDTIKKLNDDEAYFAQGI